MSGAPAAGRYVAELRPRAQASLEVGTSWRSNFAWALSGNVVYAACQWGMVVALAKLGSSFLVGQFSLGLAIATPVFMFTNLQLRAVQGTDARRQYSFREYLGLRTVTILIALAATASIVGLGSYERETALVILAVAAIKGIEAVSDIFYGLFLLNDRLDRTGKSMMCRGVISVVVLSAGLYVLRNLVEAIVLLAVAWVAVLVGFDAPHGRRFASSCAYAGPHSKLHGSWRQIFPEFHLRRQWDLVRVSLPLGIVMTLVSLNLSMPRYFIHASMGEHELGIFSAMAYTTVAVATFADALGYSTIPGLSRLYAGGDLAAFRSSLVKLVAAGAVVSLAALATVQVLGARVLKILFSPEYAAHAGVFVWLVAAAGIDCVASLLNYGITSARRFAIQVPMFVLVVGSNALACAWLIPSSGLTGAALAMVIAAMVHLAATAGILLHLFSSRRRLETGGQAAEMCLEDWEPGL
jgi:O-antigen/teichoic acid export membrane protein